MNTDSQRPIVWTIAGSDSGGGAGLQADLRSFQAMGVHGCTAVAALTAQNSRQVDAIEAVSSAMLDAQLASLASDMPPNAIKLGMLGNAENARIVAAWIDRLRQRNPDLAVVVDPVLRATTGAAFADDHLMQAYVDDILPRATLITPNRAEAAALLRCGPLHDVGAVERAAEALRSIGAAAVAITGGDAGTATSDDFVSTSHAVGWLSLPRVQTPNDHGTGCVFASSAAAALARGFVAMEALVLAKMATRQALQDGYTAGDGAGPVRPMAEFGQRIANLPAFSLPGQGPRLSHDVSFEPLALEDIGLYVIVDSAEWVRRVLEAGVRTVQLRIKEGAPAQLRVEVRESVAAARRHDAQLFINDHWQLAIDEGAQGVHLGQEDLATADLDAIRDARLRLGISTHCYWEACRAWALRPSYIACGPIHPTRAKAMPWTAQGNDNLSYWCKLLPVPVVAIGGMEATRAAQARECGASGIAVIAAVTAAASPETAIAVLREAIASRRVAAMPAQAILPRPTLSRTPCGERRSV